MGLSGGMTTMVDGGSVGKGGCPLLEVVAEVADSSQEWVVLSVMDRWDTS